ncbi:MAG: hypothetical protein LBV09_03265 [Deferribacteraceae bacterium]|jgi:predicted GNAT family acetyltransferase|nr:hypothetical protein [Deferribacteraceae bacterium]
MARHTFSFNGGKELTTMGASWFVSYCYHEHLDGTHMNWDSVLTVKNRISAYYKTKYLHKYWLEQVLEMNNYNLNKNTINLKATEIKNMAEKLLDYIAKRNT